MLGQTKKYDTGDIKNLLILIRNVKSHLHYSNSKDPGFCADMAAIVLRTPNASSMSTGDLADFIFGCFPSLLIDLFNHAEDYENQIPEFHSFMETVS